MIFLLFAPRSFLVLSVYTWNLPSRCHCLLTMLSSYITVISTQAYEIVVGKPASEHCRGRFIAPAFICPRQRRHRFIGLSVPLSPPAPFWLIANKHFIRPKTAL